MAIKFDELLEALDDNLDKSEFPELTEDLKDNSILGEYSKYYNFVKPTAYGDVIDIDDLLDVVEGNYGMKFIGYAEAKEEYFEELMDDGYDIALVVEEPNSGKRQLVSWINDRLYPIEIKELQVKNESYKNKKLKEAWEAEFESAYDALMNDNSLSEKEKDEALKQLFAQFGFNESLKNESLDLNEYGELQGSDTIAYDKGWEHYESDDMPADGVWLVKSFETDEGDLEGEIQADSNGVYAAVYKSNGSQVFSKDDFYNIGQAVLTVERVINDRYNHYTESLNEAIDPAKRDFFNKMNYKPFHAILDVCVTLDDEGNPHDIPKEWVEEWFERFIKRVYG